MRRIKSQSTAARLSCLICRHHVNGNQAIKHMLRNHHKTIDDKDISRYYDSLIQCNRCKKFLDSTQFDAHPVICKIPTNTDRRSFEPKKKRKRPVTQPAGNQGDSVQQVRLISLQKIRKNPATSPTEESPDSLVEHSSKAQLPDVDLKSDDSNSSRDDLYDCYESIENKRVVRKHLARERDRRLVRLKKQKCGTRCEICDFDFYRTYPGIGDGYAECHHICPLATHDDEIVTTLDDLIIVCSNCHRMLHRMTGSPDDINRLKQIVQR